MNLEIIREVAKQKRLSLKDMCTELGFTYQSLNHNIANSTMDVGRLEKIARYLNIPIVMFFKNDTSITEIIDEEKEKIGLKKATEVKKEYHCGSIIKKRMEEIGMTPSQLAQILSTSNQNVNRLLATKTIDISKLAEINNALNPPNSSPWDIFALFSRDTEEKIEEKYIRLLERHMRYVDAYNRIRAKYNINDEPLD